MNLSDRITKEIKNKIPMYINIIDTENQIIDIKSDDITRKYTDKQIIKRNLILKIREEYLKGISIRSLAKEFELNRATISKYVKANNVDELCIYDSTDRNHSYLDSHKDEIINLYLQTKNISEVYRKLENKIDALKYSTLRHYISKLKKEDLEDKNRIITKATTKKISRSQVIKYIFDWKYKKENTIYLHEILEKYPVLKKYKLFYQRFREYLVSLNIVCFISLVSSNYEESCINNFISSLKTDWEAVINAASLGISNGITEGHVNKIKQIKRDMYGRASYELLRKKVIYQSLFY